MVVPDAPRPIDHVSHATDQHRLLAAPVLNTSRRDRSERRRHRARFWGLAALGFVALTLADRWIWRELRLDAETFARVRMRDWFMLLREAGYLPTWILVGGCICLADAAVHRRRTGRWSATTPRDALGLPVWPAPCTRGLLVVAGASMGGLAAEVVKAVVRRWRPGETGAYVFDWVADPAVKGPGLGLASSHAGVAFGAAFVMARLFPGTGTPLTLLAVGCCVTRLLSGAHFATDCYAAAVLSAAIVGWMWARVGPGVGPGVSPGVR